MTDLKSQSTVVPYEEYKFTSAITGPWDLPPTVTFEFEKIGRTVTVYSDGLKHGETIPERRFNEGKGEVDAKCLSCTSLVPERFRPRHNFSLGVHAARGNSRTAYDDKIVIVISVDGQLTIGRSEEDRNSDAAFKITKNYDPENSGTYAGFGLYTNVAYSYKTAHSDPVPFMVVRSDIIATEHQSIIAKQNIEIAELKAKITALTTCINTISQVEGSTV